MSEAFFKAATEYIAWAQSEPGDPETEARKALGLLSELYNQALRLAVATGKPPLKETRVSDAEWQDAHDRFRVLPVRHYSTVYNPLAVPAETPVVNDLSGDLASIYRDIADGMALHAEGRPADAFDHWSRSFRNHWGRHANEAIHALHCHFAVGNSWPS
jgi:hypothetical protein